MNVKVKSTIRNPIDVGIEKREKFIKNKSDEWIDGVKDILREDKQARHMVDDVSTETTLDGFIGIIENPAAIAIEFGVEEDILDKSGTVDIASTPELAPMRRSLGKL